MEFPQALTLLALLLICIHLLLRHTGRPRGGGLPPGPRPLPLLGNILDLGGSPHRAMAELARKFGPVMTLRLGTVTTVVVSSREAARETFLKNDRALSSRTTPDAVRARDHYKHSLVWLPPTAKWKTLRRLCSMHIFSRQKLNGTENLRRMKIDELLDHLRKCAAAGRAVDVGQVVFTTVLNLMWNTLFSVDLLNLHERESGMEMKELLGRVMEEGGRLNVSDFFPALRWIDLQGVRRRMEGHLNRLFEVFDVIIKEKMQARASTGWSPSQASDMLDSLLDLRDSLELSWEDINSLLADLVVAGVDSTSAVVEWAMAQLLRHPEKMAKARAEMENVLGRVSEVRESDIQRLPYLQAVVKEILRLYQPLDLPHQADEEVELCGFKIPKGTRILVNLWTMGRDTRVWEDPDRFDPDRFLKLDMDIKGADFELIPFGSGRRICPGMPLAYRMVHLILGSLIRSFEWKLGNGETPETLDMTEKFGIALHKAKPLYSIPTEL
ncbi:hypothetical protein SAY86_023864 [Trapa natans]|uniref:Uncharacterized protein n=1 Tax=Trapa natans TaxID=22666 RepID=A0AAN7R661_TRANT|nr:hypothetical protein SAY86_023864 [Trapa natans]